MRYHHVFDSCIDAIRVVLLTDPVPPDFASVAIARAMTGRVTCTDEIRGEASRALFCLATLAARRATWAAVRLNMADMS